MDGPQPRPRPAAVASDDTLVDFVRRQFVSLVLDPAFPCLGARSAFQRESYVFHLYDDLTSISSLRDLADHLADFAQRRPSMPGRFSTLVASFLAPPTVADGQSWDTLIWRTLQQLHEWDAVPWDPSVSSDPSSPDFCFSFAGDGYVVVGLHPGASRHARRFAYPTLVFNAHDQFQGMRHRGEFGRFQESIQKRDVRLQGSVNPKETVF